MLEEIIKILQTNEIVWHKGPPIPEGQGKARSFQGEYNPWFFLVVEFDTEAQGFPQGSVGYDGTASNPSTGLIIRLTRELAKELFENARTNDENTNP